MDSKARFAAAVRHEQPDKTPFDLGASSLTKMTPDVQRRLCELLGFGAPVLGQAGMDERILEWAGADFRGVGGMPRLPSKLARSISGSCHVNEWGVRFELSGGHWQITDHPLKGASREDLRVFQWPEPRVDEQDLSAWAERAEALRADGRHVVLAEHPVLGILELGCWMCGYDDFMLRMAMEPDFVHDFFDRVLQIQLRVIEQYYSALGPFIDLTTSGDDFGTQIGPFISTEMFEELVAPYFRERIRRTKEIAGCLYWHHSCGSIFRLLERIMECGVDILNPVQTSAAMMDPAELKKTFGERIVFWGAVDVQKFLPLARPEEIGPRIRELISILGRDGGYVMSPAHEIQDDVPAENIAAWVEAMR